MLDIARNNTLVVSIYRRICRIYVNEYQYVTVDFPDIFSDYKIILGKDWWPISNNLFYRLQSRPPKIRRVFSVFIRCQLNFAIYAATSVLGISKQHLNTRKVALLRSVYRFHAYYHIRRIL